ncbi:MAG: proteasome accessory factor PafA2 family protein, partial [bacterium]|nr:proteasome accessory factor PafA2 family protein [bacterium]
QGAGERSALDVQRTYLELVERHWDMRGEGAEVAGVLELWAHVLDGLGRDPGSVADCVEWVAKKQVLDGLRARTHSGWEDPRLAALDLQWSDLRPEKSVVGKLEAAGRVRRLVGQEEVAAAVTAPPEDTRAWFRGSVISRLGSGVAAAGWSSVVLDSPRRSRLVRIPLRDPFSATRERAGSLLENETVDSLLEALTRGRS